MPLLCQQSLINELSAGAKCLLINYAKWLSVSLQICLRPIIWCYTVYRAVRRSIAPLRAGTARSSPWNYACNGIRLSWHLNKKTVRHRNQRIVCVYVTPTVRKLLCNWFDGNVAEEEGSVSVVRINTAHHSHLCPLRADTSNQYNSKGQMSAPLLLPRGSENVIKLLSLDLLCLILPCDAATATLIFCLGFQGHFRTVAQHWTLKCQILHGCSKSYWL